MELWIWLAVMAAAFQTLRFMLQKQLAQGQLSAQGATFARFAYAAPLGALAMSIAVMFYGLPSIGGWFWIYVLSGGLAQILATYAVVLIFEERNFAVGITFKKTEVIQTTLVGLIILGDRISLLGALVIFIGLIGVLILSDRPEQTRGRFLNRAALLGLASGLFFAISAVTYRGATLAVASDIPLLRALVAIAAVTATQSICMAFWLRIIQPGELTHVWQARKTAIWMGITSLGGSLGWFTAFTLQNAAYVFAVGQIEVVFSILASVFFFHERITPREYIGITLLTASILLMVLLV